MMAFWQRLQSREKLVALGGAAVLAALIIWFLLVQPLLGFRTAAKAAYDEAIEVHDLVQRAASRPGGAGAVDLSELRSILTRTAAESGVIINRFSSEEIAIDISVSGATTARLYGWLAQLEANHQIVVSEATVRPATDNMTVTARLTMEQGG